MEQEEFKLLVSDGLELAGRSWCCPEPKAVLCIVHGLGEHSGRYAHVAEFLNENGFSIFAFDLRGHGISPGKRGHTPSHEILLDDVEELLKYARAEYNDLPMFLLGHSFGGNIVSNYILKKNTGELKGAILSSSWLTLPKLPSKFEFAMARFLNPIFPSLTQSNKLSSSLLTSDPVINKSYDDDPLVFTLASIRLFLESYEAGLWAIEHTDRLKIPTLVWHGTEDKITSYAGSKAFAQNAGEKAEFVSWEGIKHEALNDVSKDKVMAKLLGWMESRI